MPSSAAGGGLHVSGIDDGGWPHGPDAQAYSPHSQGPDGQQGALHGAQPAHWGPESRAQHGPTQWQTRVHGVHAGCVAGFRG